ncbi:response regulator [Litoribrevibacter albus]|uniref:Response regulatory domain-containing protein n=1 Tax=Litoribrevibacter albus TaxID=1473156 RepID=A0AA37S8Q6_9GAMM|nr:response regulator [Litoribrevibacter albus]GLQ30229.1 hypothetical protein GCM10007876_07070 [Litoribrevibacter albus]
MTAKKKRILIVDDSASDIHLLMENLKQEYAVIVARSGAKAMEMAMSAAKPDIILLDVVMPEMDGYETCRQLKNNAKTRDIDVIFVSAHDTIEEKLAGYDAGGCDYLIKPVEPLALLAKIKLAIKNSETKKEIENDKTYAVKTAMTAMSNAGEQGVVLQFLRNSFTANTRSKLLDMVADALNNFDLAYSILLGSDEQAITKSSNGDLPPLEKELLTRMSAKERIKEHRQRSIFKFGDVGLLIKNMPEDDEKRGRIRDHIAILLEGTAVKLNSLKAGSQLAEIVEDANTALSNIEQQQRQHKETAQKIMDQVLTEIETGIHQWSLTYEQENQLIQLVQGAIEKSLSHMEQGLKIDENMHSIISRLAET